MQMLDRFVKTAIGHGCYLFFNGVAHLHHQIEAMEPLIQPVVPDPGPPTAARAHVGSAAPADAGEGSEFKFNE
jgi:hypothetical protein